MIVRDNDELQVLLNRLGTRLELDYPPTNQHLLTAKASSNGYDLRVTIDQHIEGDPIVSEIWLKEKPGYHDLLECFLAAGVIQYTNRDRFIEKLEVFKGLRRKVVYYPDTNVMYNRFLSKYNRISPDEVAIVEGVRREIQASLNYKYTGYQLSEIKRDVQYQRRLVDELLNRRMKVSRTAAFLALREYLSHRDEVSLVDTVEETGRDKERNDLIFVKTVGRHAQRNRVYPVVLTCDGLLTGLCEAEGISYFLFQIPHKIEADRCSSEQFTELLTLVSGVYGFIKLNSVIIYGEYRGKQGLNDLKLVFLDDRLEEKIRREIELCRKLVKLDIPG